MNRVRYVSQRRSRMWVTLGFTALSAACGSGTEGTEAAAECTEAALGPLCPVGSYPELSAEAEAACRNSVSGAYKPIEGDAAGAVSGACTSNGACRFLCRFEVACPCGVERITKDDVVCRADCGGCGDGSCDDGETPESCAADCAVTCGDGTCDGGESAASCPQDCGNTCGDGRCEGAESPATCPDDCAASACGDGECLPPEDVASCPRDCGASCGNGECEPGESVDTCAADCGSTCGDSVCDGTETPETCARDCGATCGDGVCANGETPETCARDCGATCGDGVCADGETPETCERDCGATCGNGECEPGESVEQCPRDCSETCGDGVCEGAETPQTCDRDCGATCGNGDCEPGESVEQCPRDCGATCGNGECEAGESAEQCARDCLDACGNGLCLPGESIVNCPTDCTPACGDALCGRGETGESCARDCAAACGDRRCEGGESPQSCPFDCGGCVPGEERCNGTDRDVCGGDGDYEGVACAPDTMCRETLDATTECVDAGAQLCHGVNLCCDGAFPRNEGATCDDRDPSTESEVCVVGQCMDIGPRPEDCDVIGDEDRNGVADCADPACADAASCCVPDDCASRGATCGVINDRCGGLVECGVCPEGETCGGGGVPHACGCTPLTCEDVFATCGEVDDGCGGTLDCGACRAPETCGGGGLPNACGVRPCIDGWCYENPLPSGEDLLAVAGGGVRDVWAVGAHLHTQHWDGDSWTLHRAPAWTGPDGTVSLPTLNGVWVAPGGEAFAVGRLGAIYEWTGGAWRAMRSPTDLDLKGIWGAAADDVWAVGAGGIFHYDGAAWSPALPGFDFTAIAGRGADDIWVVGAGGRVAHFDGAWTPVNTGVGASDLIAVGLTPDAVVLVGSSNQGGVWSWDGAQLEVVSGTGFGSYTGAASLGGRVFLARSTEIKIRDPQNPFGGEWLSTGDIRGDWLQLTVVDGGAGEDEVWAVGAAGTVARYTGARWVTNLEFSGGSPVVSASDRLGPASASRGLQRLVNGRTVIYPTRGGGSFAIDAQGRLLGLANEALLVHGPGGWARLAERHGQGGAITHVYPSGGLWVNTGEHFDGTVWQTPEYQLAAASADETERWVYDRSGGAWEVGYLTHVAGGVSRPAILPPFIMDWIAEGGGEGRLLTTVRPCGDAFVALHTGARQNGLQGTHVLRAERGSDEWTSITRIDDAPFGVADLGCAADGTIYVPIPRSDVIVRIDPAGVVTRFRTWGEVTQLDVAPGRVHGHMSDSPIVDLASGGERAVLAASRWPVGSFVAMSPAGRVDFTIDDHLFRLDDTGIVHRGEAGWMGDPYSVAYLDEEDLVCEGFAFTGGQGDPGVNCGDGYLTTTPEGEVYCSANGTLSRYTAFGWLAVTDTVSGAIQATADGGIIGACSPGDGLCRWDGAAAVPVAGAENLGWPRDWAATPDRARLYALVYDWGLQSVRLHTVAPEAAAVFATPPFEGEDVAVDAAGRVWVHGEGDDSGRLAVTDPPPDLPTVESEGRAFGLTAFPRGMVLSENGQGGMLLAGWGVVLVHP
jgi:hypothetical protein